MSEMSDTFDEIVVTAVKSQEQAAEVMDKLFAVAQPSAVFGAPVATEGRTIITASEVQVGAGFGYGGGGGTGPWTTEDEEEPSSEDEGRGEGAGAGFGGGGGGMSGGRPVAVISIEPEGVQVQPVVDVTKIALALFTTLGGMFIMLSKMRREGERLLHRVSE